MKDESYRTQDGCHNCKHCDIIDSYEEVTEYFCMFLCPQHPIPPAGKEDYSLKDWIEYNIKHVDWSSAHESDRVEPAGICKFYNSVQGIQL